MKHSFVPDLVCFDIDGTILDETHTLSSGVLELVQELQRRGSAVSLATGRPSFAAQHLIEKLGIASPSMFFAGALITDPATGTPLYQANLNQDGIDQILEVGASNNWYTELYQSDRYYIREHTKLTDLHAEYLLTLPEVTDLKEIGREQHTILKAVYVLEKRLTDSEVLEITKRFPNLSITVSGGSAHPDITYVNVTSTQASREQAFTQLLRLTGAEQTKTIAFGDAESDIPFLTLSEIGVAMGNGRDTVKAAANFVTQPVGRGGVVFAFQELFDWYGSPSHP